VQPNEFPHSLYIANYSTASATCLVLKRWLFDPSTEMALSKGLDEVARDYLFLQAVEDVNRGYVNTEDKLFQLKAMQDASERIKYLDAVRALEGSLGVVFPHCACDSRKEGRVVPVVTFEGFRLQACTEDGTKEVLQCVVKDPC